MFSPMSIADVVKIGLAAVVALAIGVMVGTWHGKALGKAETEAAAAKEAIDRINKLEANNANFKKLSARDRCLVFMRDSGLPEDGCS